MGYRYEYATEQDGEEIAALLENVEFTGEVSLAYCRRPNAVLSLSKDGEKSTFVVAKDDSGKIIGIGACVINGEIAYLTGMRAFKKVNIPKCYELLHEFCISNGVKLTYTTILEDNKAVQAMLEKKRPKMPHYLRHSECTVNIIRKNLRIKDKNKLIKQGDLYILHSPQGEEIARGQTVEQWDYKQYIVKHYGFKLKLIKRFIKWIPNENEVLKFFTLKGVKTKNKTSLESFLRHISHISTEGNFFLYGGASCPVKSINYKSIVYIVDWDKTITDAPNIPLNIEISNL